MKNIFEQMELNVYSKEDVLKLTISPSDGSTRQKRLMGDHALSLSFIAFACVPLEVYDYVEFEGARFWIMEEYAPKQSSTVEWEYNVEFYGIESLMRQALVLKLADRENDPIFSLTAPAREHMALIVANINRQMGTTDWKVGEVLPTENITLDYEGTYCNEALSMLANAAKTEFWTDGMTVNLCRCEYGDEVVLGYDNGLVSLEREAASNIKFFTRLFPIGSTRNIDPEEYGYSRLQLPGRRSYVEQNTQQGIVEHYERDAFSGIYPRRVGTLSSVRSEQRTGENGKPFTIYRVQDASLAFDPNSYEIGGLVKQMSFQSGELNGRDFEVNYDSKEKEFEIITQWPYDDDTQLPGGLLIPKVGDEYILWNIRMPHEYYALAEQEFAEAVDDYLRAHDQDRYVYKGHTDYVEVARRRLTFDVGQRVRLESDEYFSGMGYRTSRITSISQNVQCPSEMDVEISDVLGKGVFEKIDDDLGEVRHDVRVASAALPDIIRSWEETPASDGALYSSRKSEREFLNRRRGGTVEAPVRFSSPVTVDDLRSSTYRGGVAEEGFHLGPDETGDVEVVTDRSVARKGAQFGREFVPGMTGVGGRIDEHGNLTVESAVIRRFLEVPELRYNRIDITVGDKWSAPGGGVIESVDTAARIVTLKLEKGEIGAVKAGDICMGIFHSLNPAENAAEDYDDGRGNRRFAGFATVYFCIEEVTGDRNEQFRYELRPLSANHPRQVEPMAMMNFVTYGSFTDSARRTSRYDTRTYQRYLRNVSDWEFSTAHIAAQFGDLSNMSAGGTQLAGYSAYLDNIYMQGMLRSLDGLFRLDTQTKTMIMASEKTGSGMAFTPDKGLVIGKLYNPETGEFEEGYDLDVISDAALDAKKAVDNLELGGQNLVSNLPTRYLAGAIDYATGSVDASNAALNAYSDYIAVQKGVRNIAFYTETLSLPAGTSGSFGYVKLCFYKADKTHIPGGGLSNLFYDGIGSATVLPVPDDAAFFRFSIGYPFPVWPDAIGRNVRIMASPTNKAVAWQPSAEDQQGGIQIGSVNLIDGSEQFTVTASATSNYRYQGFDIGEVEAGDQFAVSVESIEHLAGSPTYYTVLIYNETTTGSTLSEVVGDVMRPNHRFVVLRIKEGVAKQKAKILFYAGVSSLTAGNSIRYNKAMVVRGNKPAMSWALSPKDQFDEAKIGSTNLIAKQDMWDWNKEHSSGEVVTAGEDADGKYLSVDHGKLYTVGGSEAENPIFNIRFKEQTQYCFKVRWKNIIGTRALRFRMNYTDGTFEDVHLYDPSTYDGHVVVGSVITPRGKTVRKLSAAYWNAGRTYIYDICLVEGNKMPVDWPVAARDVEAAGQRGRIFVRGAGWYQSPRENLVEVGGKRITIPGGASKGLTLCVLDGQSLAVESVTVYDIHHSTPSKETNRNAMAAALNALDKTKIAIVSSYDSWGANRTLADTMMDFGGTVEAGEHNHRPYALIGMKGIGKGNGLERIESSGAAAPFADISTTVIGGVPAGLYSSQYANAGLDAINDDAVFDRAEKQSIRTRWEAISGVADTTGYRASGSFAKISAQLVAFELLTTTFNNAFVTLRSYLNGLQLYADTNTAPFSRIEMAGKFTDYYAAEQEALKTVRECATEGAKVKHIDATALDQDTYYPIVMRLAGNSQRSDIEVSNERDRSTPSWSTHQNGRFTCVCRWSTIGGAWGWRKVMRYIHAMDYMFTGDQTPVGDIGQLSEASHEYIYVRGGGFYVVRATHCAEIRLLTAEETFTGNRKLAPKTTPPVAPKVDIDDVKEQIVGIDRLKKTFSDETTQVVNGLVMTGAVVTKENGKIRSMMTSGIDGLPFIAAGIPDSQDVSRAGQVMWPDGVTRFQNEKQYILIDPKGVQIEFGTYAGAIGKRSMGITPETFAPALGSNPFGKLLDITGQEVNFAIDDMDEDHREVYDKGAERPVAHSHLFTKTLVANINARGNATIKVPRMEFTLQGMLDPVPASMTPSCLIQLSLTARGSGASIQLFRNNDDNFLIKTFGGGEYQVEPGTYELTLSASIILNYAAMIGEAPPDMAYFHALATSKGAKLTCRYVSGDVQSNIYGNGYLFARSPTHYIGFFSTPTRTVFQQRSGSGGFMVDEEGPKKLVNGAWVKM